jgi:putative two-component system response regulator
MNTDKPAETIRATILVVDDDPFSLRILDGLLHADYDVLAAPCGERALDIAASEPKPDLILLDVLMPDMDGYGVLSRLRENPVTRDIPVIFTTGLDSAADEKRGLELGAVDCITKPYRAPIVLARVRTQLELKRTRCHPAALGQDITE